MLLFSWKGSARELEAVAGSRGSRSDSSKDSKVAGSQSENSRPDKHGAV